MMIFPKVQQIISYLIIICFVLDKQMFSKEKMIDAATGASPPQIRTRDTGCSPIRCELSIQSTSESGESFDLSPILLNQEKQKTKEKVFMKKYVLFIFF